MHVPKNHILTPVATARTGFFLLLFFSDHFLQWPNACPREQQLFQEIARFPFSEGDTRNGTLDLAGGGRFCGVLPRAGLDASRTATYFAVFWLHLPKNHRGRSLPKLCLEDLSEVLETASWPATHFLMTLQSFV